MDGGPRQVGNNWPALCVALPGGIGAKKACPPGLRRWSFPVPTSRLAIDLSAVEHNLRLIRLATAVPSSAAPGAAAAGSPAGNLGKTQICAVIKQDAYGMGAGRLARKLAQCGVDLLAVYSLDEARALVDLPIKSPVLVLMPVTGIDRSDPLFRLTVAGRLHVVLHSLEHATELSSFCSRLGVQLPVHVQVDSGMSRGGSLPEAAAEIVRFAAASNRLRLTGLMTHFSSPGNDEAFTREQARVFRSLIDNVKPTLMELARKGAPPVVVHAANTAATFRSSSLHATMVRVGQGLYGFGSGDLASNPAPEFGDLAGQLRHAVRWLAPIVHTETIPTGWPVGYNRTWHARRPSRIAIIPVGYAGGYPLTLGNRAVVRLTGRMYPKVGDTSTAADAASVWVPVVGRVSMDQITIDVTEAPEALVRSGMEVELIGTDPSKPNAMPKLAAEAETITHALLCGIAPSVERTYTVSDAAGGSGEATPPDAAGTRSATPFDPAAAARAQRGAGVSADLAGWIAGKSSIAAS